MAIRNNGSDERKKISNEARTLIREYALRVTRKKHPNAIVEIQVGDYLDENGRVPRTITIVPEERHG